MTRPNAILNDVIYPLYLEAKRYIDKVSSSRPLDGYDAGDILYNIVAVLCSPNHDSNNWEHIKGVSDTVLDAGHWRVARYIAAYDGVLPSHAIFSMVLMALCDMIYAARSSDESDPQ